MTRPSEYTRERILKTAVRLFAEAGYEATSVRALAAKAQVNQAAINYHFKAKEGLYREVLRTAIRALTEHQLSHAQETQALPRERALSEFIRQQLKPLSARDDVSRYIHVLNWEAVRPTAVYRKLISEEAAPFLGFAVDLIRRFMPDADRPTLIMAAVWLVGQCNIFIRHRDQLAMPPVSLNLDGTGVDRLSALISTWALTGLAQANAHARDPDGGSKLTRADRDRYSEANRSMTSRLCTDVARRTDKTRIVKADTFSLRQVRPAGPSPPTRAIRAGPRARAIDCGAGSVPAVASALLARCPSPQRRCRLNKVTPTQ